MQIEFTTVKFKMFRRFYRRNDEMSLIPPKEFNNLSNDHFAQLFEWIWIFFQPRKLRLTHELRTKLNV